MRKEKFVLTRVYTRPPKTTSQGEKKKDDDDDGTDYSEEEKKNMKGFTIRRRRRRQGKGKRRARHGRDERWWEEEEEGRCPISGFFAVIDPTRLNEQLRQFAGTKILKCSTCGQGHREISKPDFKAALEELREERQHMEHHPDRKRLSSVADFFKYTEEEGMFIIVTRCSILFSFSFLLSLFLSLSLL